MSNMAVKTRNIALTPEQAELADKEAQRLGISFSAFIRLLLSQYFDDVRFERRREPPSAQGEREATNDRER